MNIYAISTIEKIDNSFNVNTYLTLAENKGSAISLISAVRPLADNISFNFVEKNLDVFIKENHIGIPCDYKPESKPEDKPLPIEKAVEFNDNIFIVKKDEISKLAYKKIKNILDNEIKNKYLKLT